MKQFLNRCRSSAPYLAIVVLGILVLWYRNAYLDLRERYADAVEHAASLSDLQEVYPEVSSVDGCEAAEEACYLRDEDGELVARVLISTPFSDHISGYGGPVPVAIEVDQDDVVRRVALLSHDETASFVEQVHDAELLKRWNGLSVEEAIQHDVDAVSGATATSQAVINTVRHRLTRYTGDDPAAKAVAPIHLFRQILTVLALLPGTAAMLFSGFRKKFRTLVHLSNTAVLGFAAGTLLSLSLFQRMLLHGVSLTQDWHVIAVLVVIAAFALWKGANVWCTWICPYGSLQTLAGKLGKGRRWKLPDSLKRLTRHSRPIVLSVVFAAAVTVPSLDLGQVEPFAAFLIVGVPVAAIVIALTFAVLSVVQPKLWCRSFCPTGMLLDTVRIRKRE